MKQFLSLMAMFLAVNLYSQDLRIDQVTVNRTTLDAGDPFGGATVNITVTNPTAVPISSFSVSAFLSDDLLLNPWPSPPPPPPLIALDPDLKLTTSISQSIGAFQTKTVTLWATVPIDTDGGSYKFYAVADWPKQVSETNENNNILAVPGQVTVNGVPDLDYSSYTFPFNWLGGPAPDFARNEMVPFSATIRNNDNDASGAFEFDYYWSTNSTLDAGDTRLGGQQFATLSGQATVNVTADFRVPTNALTNTEYWVIAVIDEDNTVREEDENNNSFKFKITVNNDPIVSFGTTNVRLVDVTTPSSITEGDIFSVDVTLENTSNATVPNAVRIDVFISPDPGFNPPDGANPDIVVFPNGAPVTYSSIPPHQTQTFVNIDIPTPLNFTGEDKDWYFWFWVNYPREFRESNLNDNSLRKTIEVKNGIGGVIDPGDGGGLILNKADNDFSSFLGGDVEVSIYPNPGNDRMTVKLPNVNDYVIEMMNSGGRIDITDNVQQKNKHTLDVSGLADGVYLLRIKSAEGFMKVQKVMIQH